MKIKFECPTNFINYKNNHQEVSDTSAEILICNPGSIYKYDEQYLSQFKDLKVVGTPSTGVTHIDTEYCKKNKIYVYCLLDDRKGLETITASAEFTWLHIMNAVKKFHLSLSSVKNKHWRDHEEELRSREMSVLQLGVIGYGRIGKKVCHYAAAFDMSPIVYDIKHPWQDHIYDATDLFASLEQIAEKSDIIAVCPYLTDTSIGMINDKFLSQCKEGCIVVNTSRGEVVDENAICKYVKSGKIKYYSDVVYDEQNISRFFQSELYQLLLEDKVCITPHIAGATVESQTKALNILLSIIEDQNFVRHLNWASEVVATWPEWKKNILGGI